MTRAVIVLVAFALLMLAVAPDARACSCMPSGPPCQNYFQVDAVFAGTVQSVSPDPDHDSSLRTLRVEFAQITAFRAVQGATVTVFTAEHGASCGYPFKQGERYLVYAYRTKDGARLVASSCSRTRRLTNAADDLRFLQTASASAGGARVYGSVAHRERDLATGASRNYGPVADALVTLQGPTSALEARTDAQGRYEFVGLPAATYDVRVLPPPAFSTRYLERRVELRGARACFVADFQLRYDGRIGGSLATSTGAPPDGAQVEAMPIERVGTTGNIETLRTVADAGGHFEFTEVPPGRYVVGVDLTRRTDPKVMFPTTYYPGTSDAALASIVEMDEGQHHTLEPMTIPPPRRTYRLTGTVIFENGRRVPEAFISLWDGAATWRQVAAGIKTDLDGTFSFLVHEGLSYIATASYADPNEPQGKQVGASVGPFVVAPHRAPLSVVLRPVR